MNRYFFGFLLAIALVLLVIILVIHGGISKTKTVPNSSKTLTSYATTDATVRLTIDGPTVAPQNHNQVQVTISNTQSSVDVMQGYDGTVASSQSYPNTTASYTAFLAALDKAGFTEGSTSSALSNDAGYCSTGDRYVFELMQNGSDIERFWITNCSGTPKTFNGNFNLNLSLFENQIPNYSTDIDNANI